VAYGARIPNKVRVSNFKNYDNQSACRVSLLHETGSLEEAQYQADTWLDTIASYLLESFGGAGGGAAHYALRPGISIFACAVFRWFFWVLHIIPQYSGFGPCMPWECRVIVQ